jgi:hypothetical protein
VRLPSTRHVRAPSLHGKTPAPHPRHA